MYWLPYSCHTSHHPSETLWRSLNLLCHSKTDAWFMQDGRKTVWSIPYVSVVFFPSLKQNFIAYHSSKVSSRPDCIFEIHQLWQSGFSRVYSNCCCSCSFEGEIIKIGQASHIMYSNSIVNFQESMTILNVYTKKVWKVIEGTTYIYIYIYIYIYMSSLVKITTFKNHENKIFFLWKKHCILFFCTKLLDMKCLSAEA